MEKKKVLVIYRPAKYEVIFVLKHISISVLVCSTDVTLSPFSCINSQTLYKREGTLL